MTSLLFRPLVAQYSGGTCGEASSASAGTVRLNSTALGLYDLGRKFLVETGVRRALALETHLVLNQLNKQKFQFPLPHRVVSFSAPCGLEHLRSCTGSDTFNRCNLCLIKSTIGSGCGAVQVPRHDWVERQPHQATILQTGVAVLPITMTLRAASDLEKRKILCHGGAAAE